MSISFNKSYLLDKEFLKELAYSREKEIYVKIISYNNKGIVQDELTGLATGGSINIDSNSSVRRSCSLTLVTDKIEQDAMFDFYWSVTTQFELFIGLKNTVSQANNYPDILWFPQGWYLISSFSTNQDSDKFTVNISGKDKMCRLNGDNGGLFTGLTTALDTRITNTGIEEKIPLQDLIVKLVTTYGNEELYNVIIYDLQDELGLELLEYRGDSPMYLFENVTTQEIKTYTTSPNEQCYLNNQLTTVNDERIVYKTLTAALEQSNNFTIITQQQYDNNVVDENKEKFYLIKVNYGESAGYRLVNEQGLIYAGSLIANMGESVTSVLDKIVQMLGHYEYFYNIDGQFIFQKKKNVVTLTVPNNLLQTDENNELFFDISAYTDISVFDFQNDELTVSKNQSYILNNIYNDFAIWGKRDETPIYCRYAIDQKPNRYVTYEGIEYTSDKYDWRELIYQMATDYSKFNHLDNFYTTIAANNNLHNGIHYGKTGYESYYSDILSFWRDIYDPAPLAQYTQIPQETAVSSNEKIFTQSFRSLTKESEEINDPGLDRQKLYVIYNEEYLVPWVETINLAAYLSSGYQRYPLYEKKNGVSTKLIDTLDDKFKKEQVYIKSGDDFTPLFNMLTEKQKENVYISKSESSVKYPYYQKHLSLKTYIEDADNYELPSNRLYASYQDSNTDEVIYVEVDSIQIRFPENPDEIAYIWHSNPLVTNMTLETAELLVEALNTYRNALDITLKSTTNMLGGQNILDFSCDIKYSIENKMLWYKTTKDTQVIYEPLNLHFLHDGSAEDQDEKTDAFYNKHRVYFKDSLKPPYYWEAQDLIVVDKKQIYEYIYDEETNLVISEIPVINRAPLLASGLWLKEDDVKVNVNDLANDIKNLVFPNQSLALAFNTVTMGIYGTQSVYDTTIKVLESIKYYTRYYDYIYNPEQTEDLRYCWHKDIYNNFNKTKFWFDFITDQPNLQKYQVGIFGNRLVTVNDEKITTFKNDVPEIIYCTNSSEKQSNYINIIMNADEIEKYFKASGRGKAMLDVISEHIDQILKNNYNISLTSLPLYWLDVNQQIEVQDVVSMKSIFEISRLTIPLAYDGKMTMELCALN